MTWSPAYLLDKVRTDSTSGASEILIFVLENLLEHVDDSATMNGADLKRLAFSLHRAKPAMAPLFNLSNSILCLIEDFPSGSIPSDPLHELLSKVLEEEKAANPKISMLARKMIEASRIITMSYSSTVLNALRAMAEDRELMVMVAESQPGEEGRRTAKIVSSYGIETELIPDSLVLSRMKDIEAAVLGADAITSEWVVNKIGTHALALAAINHEVPSYALCSWSKLCPVEPEDFGCVEKRLGKNLTESSQMFESIPIGRFHRFVTDRGILKPSDVGSELKDYRKALAW